MQPRLVRTKRVLVFSLPLWLLACAAPTTTLIPAQPPELRPGVLAGYLPRTELPNSLTLLPPPAAPASPEQAADDAAFQASVALRGSPRWKLAATDANLKFPQAAQTFSCALDAPISAENTPHLVTLLRRSYVDAGLATYAAKDHYKRTRPFVAQKAPTCTPDEEPMLSKDGSYPSGHAALGWAWALILTELAPDRANALLERGFAYGQSRVVCGVHWQSDVTQGRVVGAAAVARLHADPVFVAQMAEARRELAAARAGGRKPAADCATEAAALKP